jgi:hypothetical protein
VLGHRRAADRELPGDLADGEWLHDETLEDLTSRRVAHRAPGINVSQH